MTNFTNFQVQNISRHMIADTPQIPYYAVIFTSLRTSEDHGYKKMAARMEELAKIQDGYLGIESASNDLSITVSYWKDLKSIKKWKQLTEHLVAQEMGKEYFYTSYKTRICLVERDYSFEKLD